MKYHNPVLLQSVLHYLAINPGQKYVDATLGGGGHAKALLAAGAQVLGLDQDPDALQACSTIPGLVTKLSNFIHLDEAVANHNWQPLMGVLFDFGMSSHQVDTAARGFSFQQDGPLDMRMDQTSPITAQTLVNNLSLKQLTSLLKDFGEIPAAKTLATKIVTARPVTTTSQLARITGPHWSRQAFQALRIAVNDELGAIPTGLTQAASLVAPGGRIVAISFHSLEDRLVKDCFDDLKNQGRAEILTPQPVLPDAREIATNPRAKSAKLRSLKLL